MRWFHFLRRLERSRVELLRALLQGTVWHNGAWRRKA
jgi:hypothetical protein